jgi:vitamin B12 transporter
MFDMPNNYYMRLFLSFLVVLITSSASSQAVVSGSITDTRGRGVAGVSITIKDSYDGATTDSVGNFRFQTTEKGAHILTVSSIGYKEVEQPVTLANAPLTINISLNEKLDELKAVMVTAGSFEASDRKRAATVLNTLDVVTVGGANADITAAVKTLPGAQQVGEQEGLFVRGGAGYETKQIIDGTVVNNPFFSSVQDIASRGRFSPMLFKGTVFSTGGYSALYGQALSSVLILESIDIPEQSQASAALSTVFLGAGFQQVSKSKDASWGVNYGYTNLQPYFELVKQKPDYFAVPQFHSGDANFRIKTKNGIIKYYTTYAYGRLGLRRADIDSTILKNAFGLENKNWYNNLSWRERLGNGWKLDVGLSYSTNLDEIDQQVQDETNRLVKTGTDHIDSKTFSLHSQDDLSQVRAVVEKKLRGISAFRFGAEHWYGYRRSNYNSYTSVLKDHLTSAFAETDVYITNGLAAKLGARYEYSTIISESNFAPRLSLAYKAGKDAQMSVAYGIFYQKPENMQLMNSTALGYTKAIHYLANYIRSSSLQTFRVEAFYKQYHDLIKTSPEVDNDGSGYAAGVELFWRDKKTFKSLDYWISYSFLDTRRDFMNYPKQMQPTFATPHTLNVVTKRFVTAWKTGFNFTYTYATGRPYYNLMYSNAEAKFNVADEGKTKDYHNVGFSLNYVPTLGKKNVKSFVVLVASVTNVLNQYQEFGFNYSHNGLRKEAITPPARQFFFVGAFLSWGVDRTEDAINNNL